MMLVLIKTMKGAVSVYLLKLGFRVLLLDLW